MLMLGKIEGRKRRGWQKMRWLDGITDFITDVSLSKFQEIVKDKEAWHAAIHGVTKNRTRLSDWTRNNKNCFTMLYWLYLFTCWFVGQHESAPGTHMLPPSWASSYLSPYPAPLGRCRPPGWAPCVIQRLPTSHPFCMWWFMYFSASLSVLPALSPAAACDLITTGL